MELTAETIRQRLADAGLAVSAEEAAALLASARVTEGVLRDVRAAQLGSVEPAPVLDAGWEADDEPA